jgi:DNA-binding IclR family transcriptional regulator
MTQDPSDPKFTDLILDYIRRAPATAANVCSHFGMTPSETRDALWSMRQAGLIYENGRHQWLVVGDA